MGVWASVLGADRGYLPAAGPAPGETSGTQNPADWLVDLFGGMTTATGLRVSVKDALTVPGIAACIQVLADDLSKVPLILYRRLPGGGREEATDHPLYGLLKQGPAGWLSSSSWRRTLVHNSLAYGNGYSRISRSATGIVAQMTLLQPGRTNVRWTSEGEPFFDIAGPQGERGLSWQDVLHLAYRGSSDGATNGGVLGVSPISQHRETVALAIATERFAAKFFANGARPSFVLETDRSISDEKVAERIRARIERTFGGVDNAFKVAVLELGMKLNSFSFSNHDSQLSEVRKDQAVQHATMFRMPPHKIGILDRATFSNIEQSAIEYVTGPVSSIADCFEDAIEVACLSPRERQDYKIEHDLNGLLRGDIQSRYRAYSIGRQWGWLNVDEIREWENLDPLPDGAGKTYLTPLNMIPADQRDDQALPADKPNALVGPDGHPLHQ